MRGKYSPTVTAAYMADQKWHQKFMAVDGFLYDPEGFDSYGYNEDNVEFYKALMFVIGSWAIGSVVGKFARDKWPLYDKNGK